MIKKYLYPTLTVVALLALSFAVYKVYDFGYSRAEDKVTAKYETTISDINKKSADLLNEQIAEHNEFVEKQNKALNQLKAENKRLDTIIKENEVEAAKDASAKRPAVSKSGVMRLNRFR
jgi:septal ring factor EnvC (AmiA/AmiB activator)